ncbi:MAG: hypothetical protein FWE31_00445 [Firmicutes bacterium]|nr:hypothetical protein [Bacillota bacterium]
MPKGDLFTCENQIDLEVHAQGFAGSLLEERNIGEEIIGDQVWEIVTQHIESFCSYMIHGDKKRCRRCPLTMESNNQVLEESVRDLVDDYARERF